jgi:hypothetical protein
MIFHLNVTRINIMLSFPILLKTALFGNDDSVSDVKKDFSSSSSIIVLQSALVKKLDYQGKFSY